MERALSSELGKKIGKKVKVAGWIHNTRKIGNIAFIILRDREGLIQAVIEKKEQIKKLQGTLNESVIAIEGDLIKEQRAPGGVEVRAQNIEVISKVTDELPVELGKRIINANLDTLLDNRTTTLRYPQIRSIFKVQAEILKSFREFWQDNDFVEINTPKIVTSGAETGGAEMFEVDYFGTPTYLAQSPQLYKQIMVGVFERVYETAYVYRAEKHNTSRHLNEYLSLDIELAFFEGNVLDQLLDYHERLINYMIDHLNKTCKEEFESLNATMPSKTKIPRMKLKEAQTILEKEYKEKCLGASDLDPKQEKLISDYVKKKYKSDFVFVTHYPTKKRPFYAYDDPDDPGYTLSFDCIMRGLEITTGGQRIHDYEYIIKKMKQRKLDPSGFKEYLDILKFGMPPHGGFCHGLERLTMRFLELDNVKRASLFPRDINRLRP